MTSSRWGILKSALFAMMSLALVSQAEAAQFEINPGARNTVLASTIQTVKFTFGRCTDGHADMGENNNGAIRRFQIRVFGAAGGGRTALMTSGQVSVQFGNRNWRHLPLPVRIGDGFRSEWFQLPGDLRCIREVAFEAENVSGENAIVQVWGEGPGR